MSLRQITPPPNPDAIRAEREYIQSLKAAKERERVVAEHALLAAERAPVRGEPLPPLRRKKK